MALNIILPTFEHFNLFSSSLLCRRTCYFITKQGDMKNSLGIFSQLHNPLQFLFLSSPALTENTSPGATVSSSCTVAGHKIPLKGSQWPGNTSLKLHSLHNFQTNKVPIIPHILLLLPAWEGEGGEFYSVFMILNIYLSSHSAFWACIIYTDQWSNVLKTNNWLRVWLPLTLKNSHPLQTTETEA